MFECFPHTADLGLRVEAGTKEELFVEAARGLFDLIIEDTRSVRAWKREEIRIESNLDCKNNSDAFLLFDWLNELIYAFHVHKMLFAAFEITFNERGLEAVCFGEPFDPERHEIDHDVKAVTYHELKVKRLNDGWRAEIILDV